MMETTPRTRSSTRQRRAPTPKLSERKKKLFADVEGLTPAMLNPYVRLERIIIEEEADDSDIGPMSPLEFSSSPSTFNEVHRIIQNEATKSRRTNFSNVMSEISSNKNDSPRSSRFKNGKNMMDVKDKNDSSSEEDFVGPLCSSMKKLSSMTEQNYEQQMKTPSETTVSNKPNVDVARGGTSFRKSLVFDTGLTPHDNDSNAPTSTNSTTLEHPKAKTSLTFNEPVISVRSFYGKPVVANDSTPKKETMASTTVIKPEIDIITKLNTRELATVIAKRKSKSTKPKKKQKFLKRLNAPSLWRFSGKLKINKVKHKHRSNNKDEKKKLHRTIANRKMLANNDEENIAPMGAEFTSRIEQNLRLQKILKEQTNALTISRDINWKGGSGATINESQVLKPQTFLNSDDEDDDNPLLSPVPGADETYEEVEVEVEEPNTNRKFFKSKSGANSAKKYRIMGRISATLKRGGDLKFDPLPKRKKKRPNDGETVFLHNEITSIIDRLSSPKKNKHVTNTIAAIPVIALNERYENDNENESVAEQPIESQTMKLDFINEMQIQGAINDNGLIETVVSDVNVEKYRQMIPYDTTDADKISQQESILELLISNGICNDETFKIFIAEPDLHKEKASEILDSLYCVNTLMPVEYENDNNTEWINSVESMQIVTAPIESLSMPDTVAATLTIAPNNLNNISDTNHTASVDTESSDNVIITMPTDALNTAIETTSSSDENVSNASKDTDSASSEKLFPIFNKNFNAKDPKAPSFNALNKTSKDWQPIGNQYQIDVGQKEFGLRTCTQCNMQYSVHEPEDELLHQKYHNCVNILSFKGWNNERLVTQIPDWGLNGRIIYVCEADSKAKKDRVKEVLEMVDRNLGFAVGVPLKPKTLVYLAIAKQQIVGVCVAQPLEFAHRLRHENGIDCCSVETYPVKCGISRVWVSPQYRRHGIAAKLITSMRGHFIFGTFLSFDEIAFSSPTEDGKLFAAKLAQRSDFLIYEK